MRVLVVPATQARVDLTTMVLAAPHIQAPEGQCIAVREDQPMMALVAQLTQVQEGPAIADLADLAIPVQAVAGLPAPAFVGE
jgi:hypothetical protein